jgi:hypothetical protein
VYPRNVFEKSAWEGYIRGDSRGSQSRRVFENRTLTRDADFDHRPKEVRNREGLNWRRDGLLAEDCVYQAELKASKIVGI